MHERDRTENHGSGNYSLSKELDAATNIVEKFIPVGLNFGRFITLGHHVMIVTGYPFFHAYGKEEKRKKHRG
jgi:hypothetical protein